MPYKDFTVGQTLTSQEVDDFLMRQTVMVFDDSASRASALSGVLTEGMATYLKDTDSTEVYNGSVWVAVGQDAVLYQGDVGQALISNGTAGVVFEDRISPFLLIGA